MAMRVFIAVWMLVVINTVIVRAATVTDYFGNEAYDNGTIKWAAVPAGTKYKTTNDYSDGGLGTLFAFARSFINSIQPKPFPFGEFIPLVNHSYSHFTLSFPI